MHAYTHAKNHTTTAATKSSKHNCLEELSEYLLAMACRVCWLTL